MTRHSVVLPLLLLAACGGGSPTAPATTGNNNNTSGSSSPPPSAASVALVSQTTGDGYGYTTTTNVFTPGSVTIAKGGTVTWSNDTGILHNVTFTEAGAPQSIPNFSGGSNERTFPVAGTYHYNCTNHLGMSGTVEVK